MSKQLWLIVALGCMATAACKTTSATDTKDDVEASDSSADALTHAKNDLSAKQATDVLKMINDHCGDSWCEGDYDLNFTKLACDFTAKTCTFTVLITDPGLTDKKSDDRTFWRSCKMKKVGTKYSDIVDTAANGYQDLNDAFYEKVDACVTKVEDGIPSK